MNWPHMIQALTPAVVGLVGYLTYRTNKIKSQHDDVRSTADFYYQKWKDISEANEALRQKVDELEKENEELKRKKDSDDD